LSKVGSDTAWTATNIEEFKRRGFEVREKISGT
jgi:hypothetical protein